MGTGCSRCVAHKLEHDLIGYVGPFLGDFFQNVPTGSGQEAALQSRGERAEQKSCKIALPLAAIINFVPLLFDCGLWDSILNKRIKKKPNEGQYPLICIGHEFEHLSPGGRGIQQILLIDDDVFEHGFHNLLGHETVSDGHISDEVGDGGPPLPLHEEWQDEVPLESAPLFPRGLRRP